jgi:hypothetical protein
MEEKERGGYRSLFWPLVLIGIGVVALLGTSGVLSRANFVVLFRLWPVLLILVGLDIMFGRRSPAIGALLGVGAVALVIGLMLIGPSLGWGDVGEVKTERFSEPIGEATSARVSLDLSSGPTEITALSDSNDLIDAELNYIGEIEFEVRGDREKSISLSERDTDFFFWFDWFGDDDDERHWDIGLSPQVPLDLEVDASSGSLVLDLSALQLTGLNLDVGSGSIDGSLPAVEGRYDARVDGGSGSCRLDIADGADVDLEIDVGSGSFNVEIGADAAVSLRVDGGSGSFNVEIGADAAVSLRADGGSGELTIDVPEDAAVRVDVRDSGSGHVRVPARFERTRRGDDDEGTWETPGFEEAEHKIEIVIEDMGSGDVEVR